MKPSVVLENYRLGVRDTAQRFNTLSLRIFGSVLRREDREGSAPGLLVDPLRGVTLPNPDGLRAELEEVFGVRIDILTPSNLSPKCHQKVLSETGPIGARIAGFIMSTIRRWQARPAYDYVMGLNKGGWERPSRLGAQGESSL